VLLWFTIPAGVKLTPQPSLPRFLVLDVALPELVNGTHGKIGEPVPLGLHVRDNLLQAPAPGLAAHVRIVHTSPEDHRTTIVDLDTDMEETAPGTYEASFVPLHGVTHFASFTVTDPQGVFPDASRIASVTVEREPEKPDGKKQSPGPAAGALAALAAAAWLRQRRR